ncbi:hypothetical protein FRB93_010822 [Tulasnella sp. JGI-2019a]|nr:hypothetical protein FRB93_010822 [Tulasnella sp. JGI-2019a]
MPEDRAVLELARAQQWRRCPSCRVIVELTQGCNHITCTCRSEFCFRCGSDWRGQCTSNPPCALWEEDMLLEANAREELEAVEEEEEGIEQFHFDPEVYDEGEVEVEDMYGVMGPADDEEQFDGVGEDLDDVYANNFNEVYGDLGEVDLEGEEENFAIDPDAFDDGGVGETGEDDDDLERFHFDGIYGYADAVDLEDEEAQPNFDDVYGYTDAVDLEDEEAQPNFDDVYGDVETVEVDDVGPYAFNEVYNDMGVVYPGEQVERYLVYGLDAYGDEGEVAATEMEQEPELDEDDMAHIDFEPEEYDAGDVLDYQDQYDFDNDDYDSDGDIGYDPGDDYDDDIYPDEGFEL